MHQAVALNEWLKLASDEQREQLAAKAGTTVAYLYQIAGGHRQGSPRLIRRIAEASEAVTPSTPVSKELMRPDVFGAAA